MELHASIRKITPYVVANCIGTELRCMQVAMHINSAKGRHLCLFSRIAAVAARSEDKAAAFAAQFDIPTSYGNYDLLAADSEVDAVYIGTINTAHIGCVKLLLNAGKSVLCEKPLGMNVKETREMIELAQEKKVYCDALYSVR